MFKKLGTFFFDILEVVVFAVGIFFFVYLLVMRPHKIKGQSMEPNFHDGEFLLTQKVSYYFEKPKRGDVVVFKPPVSEDDEYIKRIIGLPGDVVKLINGKFYLNGEQLNEIYLDPELYTNDGTFLTEGEDFTVPEGQYFVVGDNRQHSADSRFWGPVSEKVIKQGGKAWIIYWPLERLQVVEKPKY